MVILIEIQHLISNNDMNMICIYCGSELEETGEMEINYATRECLGCRRKVVKRKDFNELGNGHIENIDERVEEETKKLFLNPRMH